MQYKLVMFMSKVCCCLPYGLLMAAGRVLGNLYYKFPSIPLRNAYCFVNFRKLTLIKADIKDRSDDLGYFSFILCHL